MVKSVLEDVETAKKDHAKGKGPDLTGPAPRVPNFTVFFVPRKTLVCEELLKHQGVYGRGVYNAH